MTLSFPGESPEYRDARSRLLEREIELRRTMESVAAARRALPPGGPVPEDYRFHGTGPDGGPTEVRLSELFSPGRSALVVYSFMFPRAPTDERPGPASGRTADLPLGQGPCPSCTTMLDQLDGAAEHAAQHLDLVAIARAPIGHLATFAEERGWRRLRVLSSRGTSFDRDYHAVTPDGFPMPMLNVFAQTDQGIHHTWGSELLYAPTDPGQDPRHAGTIEPLWNLLDLTPGGRDGGPDELLDYG